MSQRQQARRAQTERAPLLSEDEAADYLGLSARTLQNYRVRGGGPYYVKLGSRAVRYRLGDLDEFIEDRIQSSTSDDDDDELKDDEDEFDDE